MSHFTVLADVRPDTNIEAAIEEMLAPYWEQTQDPNYLDFTDCTEEVTCGYEADGVDCIRRPDGKILPAYDYSLRMLAIKDGKVVEQSAGPLKHAKRTKKAKKYHALMNHPYKKLFSSVADFAEHWHGYAYNEAEQAYGYYSNDKSFWDWYKIGGRWPFAFLVKEDCDSAFAGERSWAAEKDDMPYAPEGHIWVAGAAKKDVQWELMKSMATAGAAKQYDLLKEWFQAGKVPEDAFGVRIVKDGL